MQVYHNSIVNLSLPFLITSIHFTYPETIYNCQYIVAIIVLNKLLSVRSIKNKKIEFILPSFFFTNVLYLFRSDFLILDYFLSSWKTSFKMSCKAGLLTTNSLSCYLSKEVFVSLNLVIATSLPFMNLVLMFVLPLQTVCFDLHCALWLFGWKPDMVYWVKETQVNMPLAWAFMIIKGVRLYLLFAGCVSEAKVFSDVLVFDSLIVLNFPGCIFFQITSERCCFF